MDDDGPCLFRAGQSTTHHTKSMKPSILLVTTFLAMAGCVAHWSGLWGTWVFDDQIAILENDSIRTSSSLRLLMQPRGVAYLTFRINYGINEFRPFGYQVVNLFIHMLNAILLWLCLRELLVERATFWNRTLARHGETASFSIALVWAVHPITTQAVAYLVQRMESLWSLCFLAGLKLFLLGIRCEPGSRFAGFLKDPLTWSVVCFWLGMGCKEPIVLSLVVLPTILYLFSMPSSERSRRQRFRLKTFFVVLILPLAIGIPTVVLPMLLANSETSSGGLFVATVSPFEYWLTQPEALGIYLLRIFVPLGYCFDYLWPPQSNAGWLVLQWIVLITVMSFIIHGLRRRQSWTIFPILFLTQVATTSLIPLIDLVVEHRVYMASAWLIAFCFVVVSIGYEKLSKLSDIPQASTVAGERLSIHAITAMIAIPLAVLCYQRSSIYQDPGMLWSDTVEKAPWNYRARVNFAETLIDNGDSVEAVHQCRLAVESDAFDRQPDVQKAQVLEALAIAYSENNQYEQAVQICQQAIEMTPGGSDQLLRLADIHAERGQLSEAITALERAIENRPDRIDLRVNLVRILVAAKQWMEAQQAIDALVERTSSPPKALTESSTVVAYMTDDQRLFERKLATVSDSAARKRIWSKIADALAASERWDEARAARKKAGIPPPSPTGNPSRLNQLIADRKFEQAYDLIQQAMQNELEPQQQVFWAAEAAKLDARRGKFDAARQRLKVLADQNPAEPIVWTSLGDVARWSNDVPAAVKFYESALSFNPKDSSTLNNLGALLSPKDPDRAEKLFSQAIDSDPKNFRAWHSRGNNYVRLGRIPDAIECYQNALAINPGFQPSRQILNRLGDF